MATLDRSRSVEVDVVVAATACVRKRRWRIAPARKQVVA